MTPPAAQNPTPATPVAVPPPPAPVEGATIVPASSAVAAVALGEPITDFRVIRLDQPAVVIEPAPVSPLPPTKLAAPVAPAAPEAAAPRRAAPLAPPTAKELAAAREIAQAAARPRLAARAAAVKARRPAIEKKLAGAADSNEMLQVLDVEVALQRARRLSGAGDKQREMLRVLSILMLFGLVIAVVGAMWYLQTLQQGRANLSRQRPAAGAVAR